MSPLILVIDEPNLAGFLERGLAAHGLEVTSEFDGVSGTEKALSAAVDLVVLDLILPDVSGLEVLDQIGQAKPTLPVIVLTAQRDVEHRVTALDAGAVDYIVKPFSLSELAARIRAQLRVASQAPRTTLAGADVEIDLITREVHRNGRLIRLSRTEFELLFYLMRNRGHVLTREQILRTVWGYEYDRGSNVVDVYIGYLRRKLEKGGGSAPIVTIRSIGYSFDARD